MRDAPAHLVVEYSVRTRLGAAVEAIADEASGTMVGARGERTERIPLSAPVGEERPLDPASYRLAQTLAEMPL